MKTEVLQQSLNKALAITGRLISGRGQLPVLANVLIEARKDGLVLSATNLEMGVRVTVGGKVFEEGAITVPAKSLAEFIGSMGEVNVELITEGEKLRVTGGKLTALFAGIAASEFPIMPQTKTGDSKSGKVEIKKKIVEEIAGQVAFAAAVDESRPVLTGVMVKPEGDDVWVTATDGFRLSRKRMGEGKGLGGWNSAIIFPARALTELARICSESKKEEVTMETVSENNQIVFTCGNVQLISRILEGNFPDVERVVPKEFKTEVLMDAVELTRAVRAVSIFARENNNIMKMEIGEGKVRFFAEASQTGEGETLLEAEVKGEEGTIAFNYRYVMDFLGSIKKERVTFKMNETLDPGAWGEEGNQDFLHIIMPVRI
jgi:DNA polymerase-3 subunit beta